jgi:hypothetical protein
MADGAKPRVIIVKKKKDKLEVCCDEYCIEIAEDVDTSARPATSDPKEEPLSFTPTPYPGSFINYLIISVEGMDHLLGEAERLKETWQPPVQGNSDIKGHIIFRVSNISKVDIRKL